MNQTQCVSYFSRIYSDLLHYLTSEQSRNYVLANLICQFVVHLLIEERMNQTHCVLCFTKIGSVLFHYLTSEQIRHYVLSNLLC